MVCNLSLILIKGRRIMLDSVQKSDNNSFKLVKTRPISLVRVFVYLRSRTGNPVRWPAVAVTRCPASVRVVDVYFSSPSSVPAMCDAKTRKTAPAIREKLAIYENGITISHTSITTSKLGLTFYDRKCHSPIL